MKVLLRDPRREVDVAVPVLPATAGFARQVKPLVRLSERETAAYCGPSGARR